MRLYYVLSEDFLCGWNRLRSAILDVLVDLQILRYLFFAPSILHARERNAILDVFVDLKILRYLFFASSILHARERNAILDVFVDLMILILCTFYPSCT